ncbi:MAG: hypothetical protein ETSY2_12395 [Candidatus Entotheonella gemina]|uniref:Uncharacterized protein n=1 Tax=Candidatus Entotheonella gemina TaxID=1429439 RepID=W4MAK8_9BACT|nr:MAG: hypothetical protein ETSY2_12395 [Candidatus Entotheonella gemina]
MYGMWCPLLMSLSAHPLAEDESFFMREKKKDPRRTRRGAKEEEGKKEKRGIQCMQKNGFHV